MSTSFVFQREQKSILQAACVKYHIYMSKEQVKILLKYSKWSQWEFLSKCNTKIVYKYSSQAIYCNVKAHLFLQQTACLKCSQFLYVLSLICPSATVFLDLIRKPSSRLQHYLYSAQTWKWPSSISNPSHRKVSKTPS